MNENKTTIYNFATRVLVIFSIMVLFEMIVGIFYGDEAMLGSTMFQMGNKGIAYETIIQYLLSAIITISLNTIFFSDKIFKNMMAIWRLTIMLLCQMIIIIGFILVFNWFPVDSFIAWFVFLLSFAGSVIISLVVMALKSRSDSRKYDNLLMDYKNRQKRRMDNE